MKLTIKDKSISPMIFRVNQFSNTTVVQFYIENIEDSMDLWQLTPYFITNGRSYVMNRSVIDNNSLCIRLKLDNELIVKPAIYTYQIVLKDSENNTVWYSNKAIFIVNESLTADINQPEQDKVVNVYGLFTGLLNEHLIGVPYLYEEVEK